MKTFNFAVVGLNFGRLEADRTADDNEFFDLEAVCDLDREKADEHAQRLGVDAYYDLDELLERDDIPVIGLYSNPNGRADLIRKIIRADKDVITTKPFERHVEEARSILQEAADRGRHVLMNSPSPITPRYTRQIRDWVEEYELGQPIGARVDLWRYTPETAQPGRWLDDPEKCPAAPVFRIGIYLINDLAQVFPDPEAVQVLSSRILTERPTPDNAQVNVKFEGGALANIFTSFCVGPQQRRTMILNFEHGTIYRDIDPEPKPGGAWRGDMTLSVTAGEDDDVEFDSVTLERSGGLDRWEMYHSILRGDREAEVTDREIINPIRIVEAMGRAEQSGRTEPVPE